MAWNQREADHGDHVKAGELLRQQKDGRGHCSVGMECPLIVHADLDGSLGKAGSGTAVVRKGGIGSHTAATTLQWLLTEGDPRQMSGKKEQGPSSRARPSVVCDPGPSACTALPAYHFPASVARPPCQFIRHLRHGLHGRETLRSYGGFSAPSSKSFSRTALVALWGPE